jgi:predicted NBD/HSP70 family sugar kinase
MKTLVFDLGGTHLRCALSDEAGGLQGLRKTRIDYRAVNGRSALIWEQLLTQMAEYATSAAGSQPGPIMVSFPGPVRDTRALNAPTVSGNLETMPDLQSELQRRTGREVHILNDVSAAAWYFSTKLAVDRFLVVTVSSGIGSKLFDRQSRQKVIDSVPYAGEIGHAVVDESPGAPICDCGGKGHLGAISSGRGIERVARLRAQHDPAGFSRSACVSRFGASASHLTNEDHLVPAAQLQDEWALTIVRECSRPLAKMLASIILAVGLEKVILMGGFALSLGEVYLRSLQGLICELCDYTLLRRAISELIQLAEPDEEPGLKGAGLYARMLATR